MVSVFSALYYAFSFMPGIRIMTGGVNTSIQIEAFMASIYGLLLGPYLGTLTALLGAFLAWLLPPGTPSLTSAVFLPSPAINAFIVGNIYLRRWKIPMLTLAAVIAMFWLLPVTQPWSLYSYVGLCAMWDKILALILIPPTVALLVKVLEKPHEPTASKETVSSKRIDLPTLFPIVASMLIIANALYIVAGWSLKIDLNIAGTTFRFNLIPKELSFMSVPPYSYIGLLVGAAVLLSSLKLAKKHRNRETWCILILIFSCLSVTFGGGFYTGVFMGIIGGLSGLLTEKFHQPRRMVFKEMVSYFLIGFIGNEADNALGILIYSTPFVYQNIFQIASIETLRLSLVIAPFFYFGVRLLQATITALLATPLLRALRTAGLDLIYLLK
ncbi:MAG: hypothetical protein RMJ07_05510 [Nitrososphaerota archaeon]|nr:hypothetical protein [Candidatus Bathyarchaeota archaeon]MDW8049119.1 hypothetical protein [Nitrososphaerota archaeon]